MNIIGYQSPIHQIVGDISTQIIQDGENQIFQAIQKSNIVVEKDELIKALQYDRNQYEKGYSDGRASMFEELEKIKEEIDESCVFSISKLDVLDILDNHIAELKGEKNE